MWNLRRKWHRWLPATLLLKMYRKKYIAVLLYDDANCTLIYETREESERRYQPFLERIAYLEKVVSDHADLIIQKACS